MNCIFSRSHNLILYIISLLIASNASATVEVVEANGNLVEDYSKPGIIEFEVAWTNTRPVTVRVRLGSDNTISPITSNISARNNSKTNWKGFHVKINDGPRWKESLYSIFPWDGRVFRVHDLSNYTKSVCRNTTYNRVDIGFNPAVPSPGGLVLGMAGKNEGSDWTIDPKDLKPGTSFTIRLWPTPSTVPSSNND